jgi:hypothetical protein
MPIDSRRTFLKAAAAGTAMIPLEAKAEKPTSRSAAGPYRRLTSDIISLFRTVPGTTSLKIWAPGTKTTHELLLSTTLRSVYSSGVRSRRSYCASVYVNSTPRTS